jgi:thiol peroxidase
MALIQLTGTSANTKGDLPEVGSMAPDFQLTRRDLGSVSLADYKGKKIVLNIFLSVDTGTCAQSVHQFNKKASLFENTVILCVSTDLPFALNRFCGAEGIENLEMLSDYKEGRFGKDYGITFKDGPLESLFSRAIVIINEEGNVIYTEHVTELVNEPNYQKALEAIKNG